MAELAIKAQKRETGKANTKKVRNDGSIPAIYYLKGEEGISISVDPLAIRPAVYTAKTRVINLDIEGVGEKKCVIRDIDFDPITDQIVHIDLLGLEENTPVTVEVPFSFEGNAKGVIAGGVFQQVKLKTRITCLPKDLPDTISVNVESLEQGMSLYLDSVKEQNPNINFNLKENIVICRVAAPRVSGKDAAAEEAGAEETA